MGVRNPFYLNNEIQSRLDNLSWKNNSVFILKMSKILAFEFSQIKAVPACNLGSYFTI